jgi:hypothetical protein
MRDHKPIVIRICEINEEIIGISEIGGAQEVIVFWRVEFKLLLHN